MEMVIFTLDDESFSGLIMLPVVITRVTWLTKLCTNYLFNVSAVENPSYYSKYPRSGHSLSVVSPDTTGAYNGAGGTR